MNDIEFYRTVLEAALYIHRSPYTWPKGTIKIDIEEAKRRLEEASQGLCYKCEEKPGKMEFSLVKRSGKIIKICKECYESIE